MRTFFQASQSGLTTDKSAGVSKIGVNQAFIPQIIRQDLHITAVTQFLELEFAVHLEQLRSLANDVKQSQCYTERKQELLPFLLRYFAGFLVECKHLADFSLLQFQNRIICIGPAPQYGPN